MIYRRRDLVSMPLCLASTAPAKIAEFNAATAHYKKNPLPKAAYKFKVYSNSEIKDTLNRLFGFKCAYCEGTTGGVMPIDIEHYRPKAKIVCADKSVIVPGYWWLAADWNNLLPSCIDCNRSRWHQTSADKKNKYGKENFFPLEFGSAHAKLPIDVENEKPLLINPANEDPAKHLTFVPESVAGAMAPLARKWVASPLIIDGAEDPRGRTSIDSYGLNKPEMVRQRNDRLKELANLLRSAEDRWVDAQEEPDPARRAKAIALVRTDLRQAIDTYLHWDRRYAGACRAMFKAWRVAFAAKVSTPGP
ncbi:uncharacterized protein (TIGR02646 family) [Novosphingobium sp. 1748]|uniref:hypothetical protein n=1 Tax=Novosphingobium sp. 1748 TaxID=2817760 RepID=UPI0028650A38|nr:hypothetical protein [Novosphingobium sp. 1748]MDR6708314.1 uncharacterized protein (TIGR02646 family) [Novosphingobium sp. 1748]